MAPSHRILSSSAQLEFLMKSPVSSVASTSLLLMCRHHLHLPWLPSMRYCSNGSPHFLSHSISLLQVQLCPGDVLFVPQHWWHYVECVQTAVSVNTWIELVSPDNDPCCSLQGSPLLQQPSDAHERAKEAVVRTLVGAGCHLLSRPL